MSNLEEMSDDELEGELFAASDQLSGRSALARVTAIRTILTRRAARRPVLDERDARRALELVNATRGPDRQLDAVHPVWVSSILAEPEWAELYASDDEMSHPSRPFRVGEKYPLTAGSGLHPAQKSESKEKADAELQGARRDRR